MIKELGRRDESATILRVLPEEDAALFRSFDYVIIRLILLYQKMVRKYVLLSCLCCRAFTRHIKSNKHCFECCVSLYII